MNQRTTHVLYAEARVGRRVIAARTGMNFYQAGEEDILDELENAIAHLREETDLGGLAPAHGWERGLAGRIHTGSDYVTHGLVRYWIEEL